MFIYRFCIFTPSRHLHSLSGVLGRLRQGRGILGCEAGRKEDTERFCQREGKLTAVSPPERLVLKVSFYSALRRQRGRRGTSCLRLVGLRLQRNEGTSTAGRTCQEKSTILRSNNNVDFISQRPSSRATVQLLKIMRTCRCQKR